MNARSALLLAVVVSFSACGKEVGRVPFSAEGSGASTVSLAAGDVTFWTDIDLEYEGSATLSYEVELTQADGKVVNLSCNPLGHMTVKTAWVETNLGSSHSRSGNGKMGCSATVPAGASSVKATLAFGTRPSKLTLKKADLVVKQ